MTPLWLAVIWATVPAALLGIGAAVRSRRLAAIGPLVVAALLPSMAVAAAGQPLGADFALSGSRLALGVATVSAVGAALALGLSPALEAGDVLLFAALGSMSVVLLCATSPMLGGLALLAAALALGVRWVAAAPGRVTLAAGRSAGVGAAALLAVTPFLPLDPTAHGPRPALVGGLLALAVSAGLAILPAGGWAVSGMATLRGATSSAWVLVYAPALLVATALIPGELSPAAQLTFQHLLVPFGLGNALWSSFRALGARGSARYGRIYASDLSLAVAALAGMQAQALPGALILCLGHIAAAPLLLQPAVTAYARPRRICWWALSGIPPSPLFWARYLLLAALAALWSPALLFAVPAVGMTLGAAAIGLLREDRDRETAAPPLGAALAWLPALAAVAVGLAPGAALSRLFGVG